MEHLSDLSSFAGFDDEFLRMAKAAIPDLPDYQQPQPQPNSDERDAEKQEVQVEDSTSFALPVFSKVREIIQDFTETTDEDEETDKEDEEKEEHRAEKDKEAEKVALKVFEERQREMEERNKKAKNFLDEAIMLRQRQTEEEAERLKEVQEELQKLDTAFCVDVSALRDEIEESSKALANAQKRYDEIEQEFLEAKLELFESMERKEMLTERLCLTIEENEASKSRKLSQLMGKLNLANEPKDKSAEPGRPVMLSRFTSLDEVSYAMCTTLRDPTKPVPRPKVQEQRSKSDGESSEYDDEDTNDESGIESNDLDEEEDNYNGKNKMD